MVTHRREQIGKVMVIQGVERVATLTPDSYEPRGAQYPKLLRAGTLREASLRRKFFNAALP